MKKTIYLLLIATSISGCSFFRTTGAQQLTFGMTKAEVSEFLGYPERILAVNQTRDGIQEVLQYRMSNDDVYALEFWDDYLTGYEYLYKEQDYHYVPSYAPPASRPVHGRPIPVPGFGNNRPGHRPPSTATPPRGNVPNNPDRPAGNTTTGNGRGDIHYSSGGNSSSTTQPAIRENNSSSNRSKNPSSSQTGRESTGNNSTRTREKSSNTSPTRSSETNSNGRKSSTTRSSR
ncbi:MAG: hypothetical protein LBH80_05500 [Prevotellaceae bacterium]|nr:hypothetical protein [Prevotellaceae bacterium]